MAFVLALGLGTTVSLAAGSITGTVRTQSAEAVPKADVLLFELKRRTITDDQGRFAFAGVPPGTYLIETLSPRFGSAVGQVTVVEGQEASIDIAIDLAVHHEDVVVTATVGPRSTTDLAQSVTVLDDRQLTTKASATIGETLAAEPGVSQTFYAPGASRPVIRGFGGDRIRMLQNGVGVGDASSVSPDHAVSANPHAAERVEVLRGAATLLYGSNAIGGVVNVLDSRIPDHRTGQPFEGTATLQWGSNADMRSGAATLGGDIGAFGWHVDYANNRSDDYEPGGDFGVKPNSDLDSESGTIGASWLGEGGFVGASYNVFETNYGSALEQEVRVDLENRRWDVRGGIDEPFGAFRSLRASLGGTDYEHAELEAEAVGTRFLNDSFEGRIELGHRQLGAWLGSFGGQYWTRELEAIGEEAFVAPAETTAEALFGFEELGTGAVRGQFGLRWEHQAVDSADPALRDRDYDAPSASAGVTWKAGEDWSLGATLAYSSRVPAAEELYSNGLHVATRTFELGDDDLRLEKSVGIDLAVRRMTGRLTGELGVFASEFSDYVYERDTGLTFMTDDGDEVPIVQFSQSDARFVGAEAHLDFAILHTEPHHLDVELRADYVHAELTDLDEPVPFQPPLRASIGLRYQGPALWASVEGSRSAEQDRFGPNDVATPGYTWLNATLGYRWIGGNLVHDVIARGSNLTDELSYNSVSRFREEVPLPGRDVRLTYKVTF